MSVFSHYIDEKYKYLKNVFKNSLNFSIQL